MSARARCGLAAGAEDMLAGSAAYLAERRAEAADRAGRLHRALLTSSRLLDVQLRRSAATELREHDRLHVFCRDVGALLDGRSPRLFDRELRGLGRRGDQPRAERLGRRRRRKRRRGFARPAALEKDIPFYSEQGRHRAARSTARSTRTRSTTTSPTAATARWPELPRHDPVRLSSRRSKASGLRGRGGAGFPTGISGAHRRKHRGEASTSICNADEGDPGAFMDRSVLEGNPHEVLEGMIIAAFAIGATQGYVYVRARVPVRHRAPAFTPCGEARERGLLGENILGTDFSFDITSRRVPAPSSAARRRRSWPASRDAAACRARGRPTRP